MLPPQQPDVWEAPALVGAAALKYWGIAKMAAVSKGMKTVTLGRQSFRSVPDSRWASPGVRTTAHIQALKC